MREIACNLANRRESDLRVPETGRADAEPETAGLAGQPLWLYLLMAAGLLGVVEWYLYQRRWIS